ncbi:PAS domain S-box protein [Haloplanus aerogenes]|uniref:histidine kinase n=1 Tax=Haloplanus aerogenes TaxID=660522 RepID=A0A3M0DSR6_9EURY|nr:PAS domain S-box protein [Haloplanus aerogenes]AZH25326.1 PAS domain S-box protein [Haloplanus aerogenes]RMB25022.1 PAS domain S-box-containing protein [Haloplanus aerogenes]
MDGTIRVLLVDDTADFAAVAAELLEREDDRLDVTIETDPSASLDRLESDAFDCVVSDYQMDGTDGIELLGAVRDRWPRLPFIVFTGKGSEALASEAISAGATDYVRKGTVTDQYTLLANRIVQAVSKRRTSERASRFERLQKLAREVNQALVRADDPATVERTVCERLAAVEPYAWAVIGTLEGDRDGVTGVDARSAATSTGAMDAADLTLDSTSAIQSAMTEGEPVMSTAEAGEHVGVETGAVAAIPLDYESERYGVLVVGTTDEAWSGEFERDLLADLGIDIASALYQLDIRADLRESEAKYRQLVEGNLVGVYLIQGGEFEYVNPRLAAMFGYTQEELLSDVTPFDLVIEEDHEKLRRNIRRRVTGEEDDLRYTLRGRRKSGESIEFEVHGGRIDYRGEPAIMGTLLDVTEQKRYERELERSRAEYRELFEAFPEAVFVGTEEGGFQAVNETAVERLGYSREELLSMRPEDIDPEMETTDVSSRIAQFSRGEIKRFDTVHETKSGERIPVEVNSTLIPYRGETAILATARDISERVERERELQRQNDRLEELASVVSHDLRSPLNVAAGRLEWAQEECDSPHLDDAATALKRMDRLIDDLLMLAGHRNRGIELTSIDLDSFVDRCWANVVTDGATLDRRTERTIMADESRLAQLFENLFRNSVEHGSTDGRPEADDAEDTFERGATDDEAASNAAGGGEDAVTITVGPLPDGFYVADDGPGIPESERDRIFEAGYSTNDGGTGLGLAIVLDVVESHDWEIDVVESHDWEIDVVESDTGGARFEITGVEIVS